ncbi:NUDIX hydrolase [Paraliomyxa miuraensis]|uniref:NUDIX hydrolase n=1 Tax=Paraliomyxa miuraensis TaxID=376150 RepID=UPI002259F744|nr:NUDIX hydrolase [Paraliomyxa miuraensis]MCX4246417.1 NUDIX hydrolase [Paraliomyxa miuraensis]
MTDSSSSSAPSPSSALGAVVDLGFRTAYKVAHRMLRAYWGVRNPSTHGALVAVWHDGKLLLVKNSYRRHYTLPGGYVRPTEAAVVAAQRELIEEVRLRVPLDRLRVAYDRTHPFENRQDRVTIVEVEVDQPPRFNVDNREVVWAGFETPEQIRRRPIVPHLEEYLREREAERES